MEKPVNIENCVICGAQIEANKSYITSATEYSHKPIYQLIEEFTNTFFSDEIISDAGICESCMQKFNEYDELQFKLQELSYLAKQIQTEIVSLFDSTLNCNVEEVDEKPNIQIKEEVLDLNFESIEDPKELIEEVLVTEAIDDNAIEVNFVEVDLIDTKKLPRQYQSPEEKQKIIKSKILKSGKDQADLVVVQLENNVKLYQCEICSRTFKERSKLKSHREIHTSERKVVCPTCGKSFKTAACLRSHKRVHNPQHIICDFCGKKYTQKPELVKHINFVHFNRRDYVCDVCQAGFGCKGHLKAHYLTHQEFRGISCEICGFSFHTRAKLQRHMRSHIGNRDYECGICNKRFLYSYNVSAHIRHVHWKEKRKVDETTRTCRLCNKKFQKIWKLEEHIQLEHCDMKNDIIEDGVILDDSNVDIVEYIEELVES